MTQDEILTKIRDDELPIPRPRDVGVAYAAWLAKVYEQLTPEQQVEAITLGGLVHSRSTYLVPHLRVDEIDGWLSNFGKGTGTPLKSDGSIV